MGGLDLELLFFALILLACVAAGRLSGKMGVPALLLFLLLGMLCGVDGPLGLDFSDFALAERICARLGEELHRQVPREAVGHLGIHIERLKV